MNEILKLAREFVSKLEDKLEEWTAPTEDADISKVRLSELDAGDRFKTGIGTFIVLEQSDGRSKVIMQDLYKESVQFDSNCTDYKESELRELFDTEIFAEFEGEFGAENILENTANLITLDGRKCFGTIECKVRPLTFDEARQYNELLVNNDLPEWYWTCTPWSTKKRDWEYSITVVSAAGNFYLDGYNCSRGVRPFCILNSNIFVSKDE